jgi:hypothetical protein
LRNGEVDHHESSRDESGTASEDFLRYLFLLLKQVCRDGSLPTFFAGSGFHPDFDERIDRHPFDSGHALGRLEVGFAWKLPFPGKVTSLDLGAGSGSVPVSGLGLTFPFRFEFGFGQSDSTTLLAFFLVASLAQLF